MGMGFAPIWLHQVSPLLHKTTLTTDYNAHAEDPRPSPSYRDSKIAIIIASILTDVCRNGSTSQVQE